MYADYEIKSEFNERFEYAHKYWTPFLQNALVYTLCAAGKTWSDDERREFEREGREPVEYNITRRPISFFSGYIRDNINQIIYGPVEGSDQKTADQVTKLSYDIWDKCGYTVFLDACDEMLKSGISLCGIQKTYQNDFINGDLTFFKRTYNSFLLDPTFESIDLSDCGFALLRDLLDIHTIRLLLPDISEKELESLPLANQDDKYRSYRPQFSNYNRHKNIINYDQYYKRTTRDRKFLIDKDNSFSRDITDLTSEENDKLQRTLKKFDEMRSQDFQGIGKIPNVTIKTISRPYIELHILLNGVPVFSGEDSTQITSTYPFAPLLCYLEPSIWSPSLRIQGLGAVNYPVNRQFNKRHMKITDMMDSNISTGYKYLIGSVPDITDLQQAGQNKLIGVDPEHAPAGLDSVQELQGGGTNPALIEYQQILDQLSLTLSNVNESVLGIDEKGNTQISGRLAQVRIAQGLRGNRKILDNVETTQIVLGRILLEAIQKNYPPGKVERILNETPTDQFYDKNFEIFDCVVKQGVRSASQRDAYYYELVNLKREGIVDVPQKTIIKAMAMAGLSDLEKDMEASDEDMAKQKKFIEDQQAMSLELQNAQKEQSIALAQERRARVLADIGLSVERSSEAEQNRSQAALDRARTITEIAKMNDDRLLQVLNYINMIESQEIADREIVDQKIKQDANRINTETEGSAENKQVQQAAQQQVAQQQASQTNQGGQ